MDEQRVNVLHEPDGLPIAQFPDVRKVGLKALARRLVLAAVFAQRDDGISLLLIGECDQRQ
ncbi:MAG: hypothetical protein AB7U82_28185 [Blastocatellales bacterium]